MTQRLRKLLILIVMALLALTLMAGSLLWNFTYARYAGGELDEDSPYDDDIEFVGANQYVVYSPEELVEAIENGYSYIQIGENAEEPFVIDTGVTDVTANLVIDLNGTTIVRNSRNPVLDVKRNVSAVLVYDSSQAQTGGFYNPVGSALQVSGGTLTVADGTYESGPKSSVTSALPTAGSAYLVTRTNRKSTYGSASEATDLPLISKPAKGAIGDVYLSSAPDANAGYNSLITADTYLLYTVEENAFVGDGTTTDGDGNAFQSGQLYVDAVSTTITENGTETTTVSAAQHAVLCDVASCDFYYYYPINGTPGTATAPQNYAVIYGYNDVKGLAEDSTDDATAVNLEEKGLVWPYAAVRSTRSSETTQAGEERAVGGEGYMRGGTFNTYFGTVNTYGIYAEGGTLNVSNSAVFFSAIEHGVCIHSKNPSNASGDAAVLNISGGNFKSELGNTIEMNGGIMTVTAGTFNKDASSGATSEEIAANGSAIRVEGGSLTINGTQTGDTKSVIFNVTGNNVNGITSPEMTSGTPGTVKVTNASFTFNSGSDGTMNYGIAAAGGTISATSCTFTLPGDDNNGIVASGGQITASSSTFTLNGSRNSGIYSIVEDISSDETYFDAQATDCTFNITGSASHGVYASGGRTLVSGGSIAMKGSGDVNIGNSGTRGNDNFGIEVASGEVTANGCAITVTGTYSAGVLARGGIVNLGSISDDAKTTQTTINIYLSSADDETITTLSSSAVSSESADGNEGVINIEGDITIDSNSLGITARGTVNVNGGTATVKTLRATGVYVNNGTLSVAAGATLSVTSTIAQGCSWVTPPESTGDAISQIYNGVFVHGGSLTSNGKLIVTFTGVATDARAENTAATDTATKSYAVFVEPSAAATQATVKIEGGTIAGTNAGGIYVGDSDATSTQENISVSVGSASITAQQTYAAGILTENGTVSLNGATITSDGLGVAVIGGNVEVEGGTYDSADKIIGGNTVTANRATGIYVRGGTLENTGILSVISTVGTDGVASTAYQYAGADISTDESNTNIYNGVYVNGGSLDSTGTLNVTFQGVVSDDVSVEDGDNDGLTGDTAYRDFKTKSYAVRVETSTTTSSSVTIAAGEIKNTIGGGVLVNGGTVTLGTSVTNNDETVTRSGPTVSAEGEEYYSRYLSPEGKGGEWAYSPPQTGGDAVKVVGGTLTIHGGEYTAAYGNGILVSNGTATVDGGTFTGGDEREYKNQDGTTGFYTGAGSNFGFKLLGGDLTVYAGEFSSNAGGAFAMNGTVDFKAGTIIARGASGVSAWEDAEVYFGRILEGESVSGQVNVHAASTGIAIETNTTTAPQITIYSGTYTGGIPTDYDITPGTGDNDGIWYGNGNAKLTIYDGTFQGGNRSGLFIGENPDSNIQISAGTFRGSANDLYWNNVFSYGNSTTINAISGDDDDIAYSSILSGATAYGYTEYTQTNVDGREVENLQEPGVGQSVTNTNDRWTAYFWYGIRYSVNLVYSKIEIRLAPQTN